MDFQMTANANRLFNYKCGRNKHMVSFHAIPFLCISVLITKNLGYNWLFSFPPPNKNNFLTSLLTTHKLVKKELPLSFILLQQFSTTD
jgi:hypothetical protein